MLEWIEAGGHWRFVTLAYLVFFVLLALDALLPLLRLRRLRTLLRARARRERVLVPPET